MSTPSVPEVLICGAGPTGLTLALELARRNVSFRLIEQQDRPFHGSRGKGIQPRSQELFADLGILDRLVAVGGLYPPQRTYAKDGQITESPLAPSFDPTPEEPYRLPLMVPQYMTEQVLRDRLAELGHRVEFGAALEHFTQEADGVTAQISQASGPSTIRARYLIGADGGRSRIRQALGIDFPGKTLGVRAIVADVRLRGLSRDAWHQFNSKTTADFISLCPLGGTDLFQLQAPIPADGEPDLSPEGLTSMAQERTGRTEIVIEAVNWASAYSMQARLAERYRGGRVLIAGDAAHVHPPTGGQGLNTSVQDAYNLGWKLAAVLGGAKDSLLDTYEEERRPIAAAMLGLTTDLLAEAQRGGMRRGREVQQLDLGYRGSSLALEAPTRAAGLRAGDRAPDAPLRGAAGQPTRLFSLMQGPWWTLLGYEVDENARPAARPGLRIHTVGAHGAIRDDGLLGRSYDLTPGTWVLVRPDGYIGAIVAAEDAAALKTYLAGVGLAPAQA